MNAVPAEFGKLFLGLYLYPSRPTLADSWRDACRQFNYLFGDAPVPTLGQMRRWLKKNVSPERIARLRR